MTPITKKECLKEIKNGVSSKVFTFCLFLVFVMISFWGESYIDESDTKAFIFMVVVCVAVVLAFVFFSTNRMKKIQNKNFYIVEDRLIKFEDYDPKIVKLNPGPKIAFSSLHFLNNGAYKLSATKKETYSDADYIATTQSEINDKFYLLIHNDKIIKCFNKQFYYIDEKEFNFSEGRYRPK